MRYLTGNEEAMTGAFASALVSIKPGQNKGDLIMKNWTTPQVSETETGMEVTSYMPAELDRA